MFQLERANAEEFYEIYKGVVQEYPNMVTELSSGPSIALEIRAQDAPKTFREFCGPSDPVKSLARLPLFYRSLISFQLSSQRHLLVAGYLSLPSQTDLCFGR